MIVPAPHDEPVIALIAARVEAEVVSQVEAAVPAGRPTVGALRGDEARAAAVERHREQLQVVQQLVAQAVEKRARAARRGDR